MQLTLLSHSCLWLEHAGTSVLVDPWLAGTAYDGAWALLPAAAPLIDELPRPDWILYSHGHPDHFHLPTLEALAARFGRDLRLLLPRHALPSMQRTALAAGFHSVREIPFERPFALGDDFSVRLTAARADDSVQVFRCGRRVVLNANDCRLEAPLRRRLASIAPAPDFHLGQFSAADAYPFALDGLADDELHSAAALPARLLLDEARALAAGAVIPIGGFIRFAHAENAWMNRWRMSVAELEESGAAALCPGDGWSEDDGFRRQAEHRRAYEREEEALRRGELPLQVAAAAPARGEIRAAAEARFGALFAALPAVVRRRIGRLGFHLEDTGDGLVVDFGARRLEWGSGAPPAPHYALGAAHFAETCRAAWGWSDFHIAARFRVRGWRGSTAVETFLPASILCELGYLGTPLLELMRPRVLQTLWARRREIAALAARLAKRSALSAGPFARL